MTLLYWLDLVFLAALVASVPCLLYLAREADRE